MKNMTEMRTELLGVLTDLRKGKVDPKIASQINNTAGKVIKTCHAQMEYRRQQKKPSKIAFLED